MNCMQSLKSQLAGETRARQAAEQRERAAIVRAERAENAERPLPSEGKGHTFESCRARQQNQIPIWIEPSHVWSGRRKVRPIHLSSPDAETI